MLEQIAEKMKVLKWVIDSVEKQFGKGAIMALGDEAASRARRHDLDRLARARSRDGRRRLPARPRRRGLRPGVERQDDARAPRDRRGAAGRRRVRVHRRRARDRRAATRAASASRSSKLLVSQPDTGEQALDIAEMLVRSGAVDLIVIDSVAALTPKAEIEGEMGDQHMGLQARLMSQALRKLTAIAHRTGTDAHVHQPAPPEDRRHVRQPRDDDRRQRAEVLRVDAPRRAPHRPGEDRRRARRRPHAGQDREEQMRAAVHRGGVRDPLRARASTRSAS